MASISVEVPDATILDGLKRSRGFDAEASNPGGFVGVQTTSDERTVHVTLNFKLTDDEWRSFVWDGSLPAEKE